MVKGTKEKDTEWGKFELPTSRCFHVVDTEKLSTAIQQLNLIVIRLATKTKQYSVLFLGASGLLLVYVFQGQKPYQLLNKE